MTVPSSTSSSNNHVWIKSWLLALLIVTTILGSLEYFWRINGHQPVVVDDQRLWSIERSKVGTSEKEIILLGSSRMQTDISMSTLRNLAPDHNIINLSIDSTCANATLHDLSKEKNFKGTVIIETTSECLMFGDDPNLSQQFYIDYYHRIYNLNVKANRIMATFMQKHLTIIDPYLNIIKVVGDIIVKKKWRRPNYLVTYEDRSRSADYTKIDINRHKALRLQKINVQYRQLLPRISTHLLMQKIADISIAIKTIKHRGGQVILIRFPVSNEHWLVDQEYFPRNQYWDTIIPTINTKVIHFMDVEGINKLQCPDTSHLDAKDTRTFTKYLFREILK